MATKRIKLGSPAPTVPHTDWTLCALCQQSSSEPLRDPSRCNNETQSKGYETLTESLQTLEELNSLPMSINISRLNEGMGIAATLKLRNAKWHKSCYLKCNKTQVDRVRKRVVKEQAKTMNSSPLKSKLRGASSCNSSQPIPICFFCDTPLNDEFHKAATLSLDENVHKMATELNDTQLLAKLSYGDMVAKDAVYHKNCLTQLYNKYKACLRQKEVTFNDNLSSESIALAELISYVEGMRYADESILKLSNLVHLYRARLEELSEQGSQKVNATRLKEKLLLLVPDLEAHKTKYEVVLSFKTDIGEALLQVTDRDHDSDAVILMRAAGIVRKEIFQKNYRFHGSLLDKKYDDLPSSLLSLIQMILGGTNIENQMDKDIKVKSSALSITQLLVFNAVKRGKKSTDIARHNLNRETRLPLYLGLLIHSKTRKRELIEVLFQKGLSVSYDRIIQINTDIANGIVDLFEEDGVVCPTNLRKGLFTTGNLDNLDHNPSSTSAQTAFHGTAISLTQHATVHNTGIERHQGRVLLPTDASNAKSIKPLMESFSFVQPASFPNVKPPPHKTTELAIPQSAMLESDDSQLTWLKKVCQMIQKENLDKYDNISWSAYFAQLQHSVSHPPALSGLLPLFYENAHSLAMIKHGMEVILKVTEHLNPGQIPVMTVDQPLYAIAKEIQWTWPKEYGEQQYVVHMGGLHIEKAFLKVLGNWLDGSGWTAVMAASNVTTEGRAEALQNSSHISRCQWAHQVTAAALFILKRQAYTRYQEGVDTEDLAAVKSFEEWCTDMENEHPQFLYWSKTLKMEILFFQFMKSQREGNFSMYVEALGSIAPWMFALDHFHYARWLSVHVRDLLQLEHECPEIWREFKKGHFVTQKTKNFFSMMAHDHIHEQLNAIVKGDGGIVGITENESALKRWMVAGPETARMIHEFDETQSLKSKCTDGHHEQIFSIQQRFAANVRNIICVFNEMGNPFAENGFDLFAMDTKITVSNDVIQTIKTAEKIGKEQYMNFVNDRMVVMTKSFRDTIPKNNFALFKSGQKKEMSKSKAKIQCLKSDLQLFSRMYISCQAREGEVDTFFEHENHAWPPSLADNNLMHQGNKANLLKCLEPLAPSPLTLPKIDIKILDGAALLHKLEPKHATTVVRTFRDYASIVFLPYIMRQLQDAVRVDVVWDSYISNSLKAHIRQCRGTGNHLHVSEGTRLPHNWKTFLRVDANKAELFQFLALAIESAVIPDHKILVTTMGEKIVSRSRLDVANLQPCTHEEADYRIMLHCAHAYSQGLKKIMVHATDTDVLVLAITTSAMLEGSEIWLAFGHGCNFRYIAAHTIASALGEDYSKGLLFMHAFSGCDTASFFNGIGKKTAWEIWRSLPTINNVFSRLSKIPSEISEDDMEALERYVVILYNHTSPIVSVNEARKKLFSRGRKIENLPPTKAALLQHVKRAAYQAGHIWGQALYPNPILPSPSEWGWKKNNNGVWIPLWTTLAEASKECRELIKCNCKKRCLGRCQCHKANLKCTQLCFCGGQCMDGN